MAKFTTQDYGQMLLNGVDNFTATYFLDVIGHVSHDSITRSIADIKLSPKVLRELEQFWILDYRAYDKARDGKKKTEQALEMIEYWQAMDELHPGRAPFTTVLIDAGYTLQKDHAVYCS